MDISIIIPLYKGNKYISKLMQMMSDNILFNGLYQKCSLEVIFVNDYPSEEIFVEKTNLFEVKVIYQKQNMGIHASRIEGIKHAGGKYLIMLDQDDLVESNWLFSQWSEIKRNNAEYCVCNGWSDRYKTLWKYDALVNQVNNVDFYLEMGCAIISPGQVIMKKESIPKEWLEHVLKVNGADDFLLWILALKNGKKFIINDNLLYYHTPDRTQDSITKVMMIESVKEVDTILKKIGILTDRESPMLSKQIMRLECRFDDSIKDVYFQKEDVPIIRLSEYRRSRDISHIYHLWFQTKNQGKSIAKYLKNHKMESVAIYGMGMLGTDLYEELTRENINVEYAIDQSAVDHKRELKIYTLNDEIKKVDITIVTVVGVEDELIAKIYEKNGGKAVSLKSILSEVIREE